MKTKFKKPMRKFPTLSQEMLISLKKFQQAEDANDDGKDETENKHVTTLDTNNLKLDFSYILGKKEDFLYMDWKCFKHLGS